MAGRKCPRLDKTRASRYFDFLGRKGIEMSKAVIGTITLIIGLAIGTVVGTSLIGGAMAGAGTGVGLSAGICSTVKAAEELGYLSSEQVDEVLNRAARDLSGKTELAEGEQIIGSSAACSEALDKIK